MKVVPVLLLSFSCFAQSVIDLGNLEVEGEVRRPMINLFRNPLQMNKSYQDFAQSKVSQMQEGLSELNRLQKTNKKIMLDDFEKQMLQLK